MDVFFVTRQEQTLHSLGFFLSSSSQVKRRCFFLAILSCHALPWLLDMHLILLFYPYFFLLFFISSFFSLLPWTLVETDIHTHNIMHTMNYSYTRLNLPLQRIARLRPSASAVSELILSTRRCFTFFNIISNVLPSFTSACNLL